LEWIQQNTEGIIPASVNLWGEFDVRRSMRRGAITEDPNTGIDGATIAANNGWRKVEEAKFDLYRFVILAWFRGRELSIEDVLF
jgi:hypothetical protein